MLYDLGDPMGKLFFNILATFAEFEADLIRMRTGEGMAIARDRGKLRGKQPKLSNRQRRDLCRIHATGEYSISDLAEFFSASRPIVYPHSTGTFPLNVRSCPYRNRPALHFRRLHLEVQICLADVTECCKNT